MLRLFFLILVLAGAALLYQGLQAYHSFADSLHRFFAGSSSDRTVWMIVGGAALAACGLGGLLFGGARR